MKFRLITPELQKDWESSFISMEVAITGGKITVAGNITKLENPLRADYVLYMNEGRPIAVLETKSDVFSVIEEAWNSKIFNAFRNKLTFFP